MSNRSNLRDIGIGVAAVAVIIGGAVWFDMSRSSSEPETEATAASASAVETETASTTATTASTVEDVAPEIEPAVEETADVAEPAVEEAAPSVTTDAGQSPVLAPSIDTFFRNPDETTIIAGRATPGQVVAIMLGREEIDRVTTAADGTFGTVVFIEASSSPRRLRLIGDPDGEALASAASVIVPPSEPVAVASAPDQAAPNTVTADAADEGVPTAEDSADPVVVSAEVSGGDAPDVDTSSPAAPNLVDGGAPVASAPPTLIADASGVRVLQRPDAEATKPAFLDNIALDTITYDTKGEVILAGRAASEGFVQVYLDNKPITTSRIDDGGDWQIDLPDVDTGVYTLRVDEIDAEGNVTSRIETPFKREEPETVAAIMAEDTSAEGFDVAVRTVQPGATLWAIAEEQFGEGIMYVSVFEANRDQIRDPDLIYPGQVFRIPEVAE